MSKLSGQSMWNRHRLLVAGKRQGGPKGLFFHPMSLQRILSFWPFQRLIQANLLTGGTTI